MRKLYFTILITLALVAHSQQGDFLLTEHFPQESNIDNTNFEIINDNLGRLCVANRSGVLKYDGEAWDFYKTPSAALSIAVDDNNVVYVGCIGSVGMIDFKERSIIYQPIVEADSIQELFLETIYNDDKVYFMGSEKLIVYDLPSKSSKIYNNFFLNIYQLDGNVFVNTSNYETYEVGDELTKVSSEVQVSFAHSRSGNPSLALDFDGKIHS